MRTQLILSGLFLSGTALAAPMTPVDILSRIHNANLEEIEVGQMANEKGNSPKIKEYGEHLFKDHSEADKEVLAIASEESLKLEEPPTPKNAAETKMMAKHKQAKAKLETLSGQKFDEEFTKAMKDGHQDVLTMLKTARTEDSRISALIKKLIPKLEEHRKMAASLESVAKKESK